MGMIEDEVEVKCSADKVFKVLAEGVHQIPSVSSDNIQGVKVQEGDWATSGSVKLWNYTIDGKKEVLKEKVEVHEESKSVIMVAVGGHVLEKYKAFKIVKQVVVEGGTVKVKVKLVYEKFSENDANPDQYLSLIVKVVRDTTVVVGK